MKKISDVTVMRNIEYDYDIMVNMIMKENMSHNHYELMRSMIVRES